MEVEKADRENTDSEGSADTEAPTSRSEPGLVNRAFTATTLIVGFGIIVIMLFATFAPGPRPFLRGRVEVLGSTESTVAPVSASSSASETSAPSSSLPDESTIDPNDDWSGAVFGVRDTTFGDEPVLDALHTRCSDEDHLACDDLVALTSETRSPYELWGLTCGDRSDLITGTCVERFGDQADTPSVDLSIGDCLALPRSADGTTRILDCQQPHDAQLFAHFASNDPLQALDGSFYVGPEVLESMNAVCTAAATRLLSDDSWAFPTDLRAGVIAPTAASADRLFGCFLWAPGWPLEESLFARG